MGTRRLGSLLYHSLYGLSLAQGVQCFAARPEFRSSLIPSSILLPFSVNLNFPAIKRTCLFSCLDTPEAPVCGPVSMPHPANKAKEVIAVRNVICVCMHACLHMCLWRPETASALPSFPFLPFEAGSFTSLEPTK